MVSSGLPPYTVRVSTKARRVRLTVTARDGLVVVVPSGWRGDPEPLVASHVQWASAALARVAEKRAQHAGGARTLMPERVEFGLTGESLPVRHVPSPGAARAWRDSEGITVSGPDDADALLSALTRWLDAESRVLLIARFEHLAQRVGAHHAGVRVRRTRSRWGSCSARKTISLSRNLVFLAPELVDSVMLHEIAHLTALDHSSRFYRALEAIDPQWRIHRAGMREAAGMVPAWADA